MPTALKTLRGNPGRRPLNDAEPKPASKLPPCPPQLSDEAKKEWRRMGRRLLALGLVTEIDQAALAAYCQTWARWLEAEEQIAKHGTVWKLKGKGEQPYVQQSPYLGVANKALEQLMRLLVEFGMSPASRSRVHASPPGGAAEDPLDEFLRARG